MTAAFLHHPDIETWYLLPINNRLYIQVIYTGYIYRLYIQVIYTGYIYIYRYIILHEEQTRVHYRCNLIRTYHNLHHITGICRLFENHPPVEFTSDIESDPHQ